MAPSLDADLNDPSKSGEHYFTENATYVICSLGAIHNKTSNVPTSTPTKSNVVNTSP